MTTSKDAGLKSMLQIREEYDVSLEQLTEWKQSSKIHTKKVGAREYIVQDKDFVKCMKNIKKLTKKRVATKKIAKVYKPDAEDIKIDQLIKQVKRGCINASEDDSKWAKISIDVATLEMKRQASNHLPPERYYEIIEELLKIPTKKPTAISGYSGGENEPK